MNPTTVTLTVVEGQLVGKEYEFHEPAAYVIGRAEECYPRLPDDFWHKDISRHHCLLTVHLPDVWVQDLGSKNGTFVNGQKIGQRPSRLTEEDGACHAAERHPLADGDEIALGHHTVLRVGVRVLEDAGV
jgi:pSer/pThr/pTyr-binding forkhead associated (FHA) protein